MIADGGHEAICKSFFNENECFIFDNSGNALFLDSERNFAF